MIRPAMMRQKITLIVHCAILFLGSLHFLQAQLHITTDLPEGIYEVGETVIWNVELEPGTQVDSVTYKLKEGGLSVTSEGLLDFENNKASVQYTFTKPGAILLDLRWKSKDQWHKTVGGAIADPEKIALAVEKPTDFDTFWAGKIEQLRSVPKQPQVQRILLEEEKEIEYYHIKMKNIDRSHIRGQLAKPLKVEKLPALLIVQWAGVYPLQPEWVIDKAKKGWLVLNINPHDLPIDREQDFYEMKSNGPLKNYPAINNENRDKSYFLRMYLSCYRAAQYLTERPDWDGETLVVMGASQGGLQALVTAGLHPKVTASMALVPAGFDTMGPAVGRKDGWPHWYTNTENKNEQKVHETSRYFDVANFVPDITCPVLVGIGLLDETCPPEGIYAGINQLSNRKEIVLLPRSAHQARNGSQDAYHERVDTHWLPHLRNRTFLQD
ncbi:prolyl oligopeptidase family serine peptidase [Flavobacteriaceae bacterium TP-CH-4]|uniref:Prolyl oligopeptidase family serine peptidase n=1 Tax=Pelagihabitans pacificus TaxID=2696054 RepID=A0A967AS69_9FLAO|nr:acetylxylan esterase [Pelagihabitans pacificus]NHF57958.1 prolyl oligopeptidase family serine peptidase [Pelagihabitans pacificus]